VSYFKWFFNELITSDKSQGGEVSRTEEYERSFKRNFRFSRRCDILMSHEIFIIALKEALRSLILIKTSIKKDTANRVREKISVLQQFNDYC